jgi:hypothetical protein
MEAENIRNRKKIQYMPMERKVNRIGADDLLQPVNIRLASYNKL